MYPALTANQNLKVLTLLAIVSVLALTMRSAAQSTSTTKPTIKYTHIRYVSPAKGKQMYDEYCAACHGANAKGDGPAASVLQKSPVDLTSLSVRNGGRFPKEQVRVRLMDVDSQPEHGATDMPYWHPLLKSLDRAHPDLMRLRVNNLVNYLETAQAPAVGAASGRP